MPDFPYMQFYAGDWMSDPKLSMCSPATRGFWMDALCAMHAAGRAGELSGTTNQLARACRCLPAEASTAIADLRSTGAADVTERNGVVTLICRRMKRENDKRKSNNERQKKHRNGGVTPDDVGLSHENNGTVTDTRASNPEPEPKDEAGASSKKNKARGAVEELRAYAVERQLPASDGEWLYDKMLTSGWKVDGKDVKDWQALIRVWQKNGYFPSQKFGRSDHLPTSAKVPPSTRSQLDPEDFMRWQKATYPNARNYPPLETASHQLIDEYVQQKQ